MRYVQQPRNAAAQHSVSRSLRSEPPLSTATQHLEAFAASGLPLYRLPYAFTSDEELSCCLALAQAKGLAAAVYSQHGYRDGTLKEPHEPSTKTHEVNARNALLLVSAEPLPDRLQLPHPNWRGRFHFKLPGKALDAIHHYQEHYAVNERSPLASSDGEGNQHWRRRKVGRKFDSSTE